MQGRSLQFCATVQNGMGFLTRNTVPISEHALATSPLAVNQLLLHKQLAHIGSALSEKLLVNDMAKGIHISSNEKIPQICEPCIAAKQHCDLFPKVSDSWTSKPLDLIVSDIHGPLPVRTPSGHRYWMTFTDDCMRYRSVYLWKTKDEAFKAYWSYKALAENQIGLRIQRFRDDKGGEYIGKKWDEHFKHWGIIHECTTKGTPQHNGISEQTNCTLIEGTTALLHQACCQDMLSLTVASWLCNKRRT